MRERVGFYFIIISTFCFMQKARGQSLPEVKYREGQVWVVGVTSTSASEQPTSGLRVYTQEAFDKQIDQPIAGIHAIIGDNISFTPKFSFVEGVNYIAIYKNLELKFSIAKKKWEPVFIEAVHPQTDILPDNTLRMYISFSSPMMAGEAFSHITLLNENGTPVDKAFLVIDQELWDSERKRFTLLFDPGRIKRGIQSNLDYGAPLVAGQNYKLVIDSLWRDVHGNSLIGSYVKSFSVTNSKREKINIQHWKITEPIAGTFKDFIIEFDRPLDYVLSLKCITIQSKNSGNVQGKAVFTGSNLWHFTPDQPWLEGEYLLSVSPQLEDVAGNSLHNPFEVDLSKEERVNSSDIGARSFFIRPLVK